MSRIEQAVILAGGKGTRLAERLEGRPKPLVNVLGVPLLERQVLALREHGVGQILVLVNHLREQIEEYCARRQSWGIDVRLIDDGQPRGTAGAVLAILDELAPDSLVVYGDTVFNVDLGWFAAFHERDPAAAATLFLHPNDHPSDSDVVLLGHDGSIREFVGYPHPAGRWLPNMVNAALYLVRREALRPYSSAYDGRLCDFAKHLFPRMLGAGARLRGYVSPEYVKDIGTPQRLDAAERALARGVVERASLRQPQRAVFLDRDGTLTVLNGHVARPEALEVYDFAPDALTTLRDHEFRTILVTNQPVVARGDCTLDALDAIHAKLETVLGRSGAFLDRIVYCPHHPEKGFTGEVPELKIRCECRKPAPGMLLEAARELNLDLASCWLVGDSTVDLAAARAAGVTSVLVKTGEGGCDGKYAVAPDFTCADVREAARFIVEGYERVRLVARPILEAVQPGEDWFIGGTARSGKSTLASVIARELRARGMDVRVIALDRWLRAEGDATSGFLGRHDVAAMRAAFEVAAARHGAVDVVLELPFCHRARRTSQATADAWKLGPSTLVLWEGVSAGLLADHAAPMRPVVYVEGEESARTLRGLADMVAQGLDKERARQAWQQRLAYELPTFQRWRERVAFRISLDDALGAPPQRSVHPD